MSLQLENRHQNYEVEGSRYSQLSNDLQPGGGDVVVDYTEDDFEDDDDLDTVAPHNQQKQDNYTDSSGMPVTSAQGYLSRPVTPLYTDEEDHPQTTVSHNPTQDHTQTSPDCYMSDHTLLRMFAENFEGTRNVCQDVSALKSPVNGHPRNSQLANPAQLNGHIKNPVKSDGYLSHSPSLRMTQRDNSKTHSGSGSFYETSVPPTPESSRKSSGRKAKPQAGRTPAPSRRSASRASLSNNQRTVKGSAKIPNSGSHSVKQAAAKPKKSGTLYSQPQPRNYKNEAKKFIKTPAVSSVKLFSAVTQAAKPSRARSARHSGKSSTKAAYTSIDRSNTEMMLESAVEVVETNPHDISANDNRLDTSTTDKTRNERVTRDETCPSLMEPLDIPIDQHMHNTQDATAAQLQTAQKNACDVSHSEQCQYSDNSSSLPHHEEDVERGGDDRDKSATSSQNILIKLKLAAYRQSKHKLTDGQGGDKSGVQLMSNQGSLLRSAIPYLPLPVSCLCLILSCMLPGVGTILSGFSVMCCGRPRVQSKDEQITITVCLNLIVGLAQMLTVTFMFVGWFWSIAWGIYIIILSKEFPLFLLREKEIALEQEAANERALRFIRSIKRR